MKRFPKSLTGPAAFWLAICSLPLAVPATQAQLPGSVIPVANTEPAPAAAATPAIASESANVENPPPGATPDPNAPIETEILATNGANFASKDRIAVFEGDVRVNDPRFQLACDKLTVFLSKGAAPEGASAATPTPRPNSTPPTAGANSQSNPGGGIDHAVAEGHVIIIQKRAATKPGEEPKVSMGRSTRADFDNKTGDMVLRGMPSVEQNGNTHVALAETTVMTLHKDNSMNTQGPSRTVITSHKGGSAFDLPGANPAGGVAPKSPGGKKPKKNNGSTQG